MSLSDCKPTCRLFTVGFTSPVSRSLDAEYLRLRTMDGNFQTQMNFLESKMGQLEKLQLGGGRWGKVFLTTFFFSDLNGQNGIRQVQIDSTWCFFWNFDVLNSFFAASACCVTRFLWVVEPQKFSGFPGPPGRWKAEAAVGCKSR